MTTPENPGSWSDATAQQPAAPPAPWPAPQQVPPAPVPPAYPASAPPAYPASAPPSYPAPGSPTYPAYAPPPAYQAQGVPGYGQPAYVVSQPTNSLAIVSLILAVVGAAPVGAILGHVARKQIRERGEQGDGLALAGIIIGWIFTGIWVLLCGFYVVVIGLFAANANTVGSTGPYSNAVHLLAHFAAVAG